MENIKVYVRGREMPFSFVGDYLGHTRPDGVLTKNWYYYRDDMGKVYHFRKEHIQVVISGKK